MPDTGAPSSGMIVTDGAGDRYEVVGYLATFTLKSLDRPNSDVFQVSSATLARLGIEWDGRVLQAMSWGRSTVSRGWAA